MILGTVDSSCTGVPPDMPNLTFAACTMCRDDVLIICHVLSVLISGCLFQYEPGVL